MNGRKAKARRRSALDLETLTRARLHGAGLGSRMFARMAAQGGPDAAEYLAASRELEAIAASPKRCREQAKRDLLLGTFSHVACGGDDR